MNPDHLLSAEALEAVGGAICEWTVDQLYAEDPSMNQRYGADGRRLWRNEIQTRLAHLVESIATNEPAIFLSNASWSRAGLLAREMGDGDLEHSLRCMSSVIQENVVAELALRTQAMIDASVVQMREEAPLASSTLDHMGPDGTLARLYLLYLLQRNRDQAFGIVDTLLASGMSLGHLYERVIAPAMAEIGHMWHLHEASIADEHFCTAATQVIMAQLRAKSRCKPANGLVVITCCAGGDLHELGIRMVSDIFEVEGWRVECLGPNMPSAECVAASAEQPYRPPAHLVAISAGTPLALRSVAQMIQQIRAGANGSRTTVLVGGRPFHLAPNLWRTVGADGYAPTVSLAATIGLELVRKHGIVTIA